MGVSGRGVIRQVRDLQVFINALFPEDVVAQAFL